MTFQPRHAQPRFGPSPAVSVSLSLSLSVLPGEAPLETGVPVSKKHHIVVDVTHSQRRGILSKPCFALVRRGCLHLCCYIDYRLEWPETLHACFDTTMTSASTEAVLTRVNGLYMDFDCMHQISKHALSGVSNFVQ